MSSDAIILLFWIFIVLNFFFWYYVSPAKKEKPLDEDEDFVELEMIKVQEENNALFEKEEREEANFIYNVQNARDDTIILKLLKARLLTLFTQRWEYQQENAPSKKELYNENSVMSQALQRLETLEDEMNLQNYVKKLQENFDKKEASQKFRYIWGSVEYVVENVLQYI